MSRTRQDKTGTTDAVELNDAALDQAAGGGVNAFLAFYDKDPDYSATSVKSITDGTSNTVLKR